MSWKTYVKTRFLVVGDIVNPDQTVFPPKTNGRYVVAKCLSKLKSDTKVEIGQIYTLFWPNLGNKCDAPNPPFQTGESPAARLTINYKKYHEDRFQIVGDFTPDDPNEYPAPSNNGEYKIAKCINILKSDPDVKKDELYIIIVYPDADKAVDAPNPPFQSGDGIS